MKKLENKVAVITGATSGMALATAKLFVEEGAYVYIMEMLTILFRAKLTQGLADFWVAANAIKAYTKIVI